MSPSLLSCALLALLATCSEGFASPFTSLTSTFCSTTHGKTAPATITLLKNSNTDSNEEQSVPHTSSTTNRRDAVKTAIKNTISLSTATILASSSQPKVVFAKDSTTATTDAALLDEKAKKFRKVPVFALVDGTNGTPFMILQNTGVATGYFFTTYDGANLVLTDAKRDAAEQDLSTQTMWSTARISAVNMEFALKLQKGRPRAMAQNGIKYETVYDIIPGVQELTDASRINKSGLFKEQGRVPLFFSKEFTTGPEQPGGEDRIPVFLSQGDLLREYIKKYPEKENTDVVVYVTDLFDTFAAMLNPSLNNKTGDDFTALIRNLLMVPSPESRRMAVECEKSRGTASPYKLGEMIAVGGKQ